MKTLYFILHFFFLTLVANFFFPAYCQTIGTGSMHAMFICDDGSVVGAGINSYGQLGNLAYLPNSGIQQLVAGSWKTLACGAEQTFLLRTDGTLWSFGRGGRLGVGDYDQRNTPVQVSTDNDWMQVEGGVYTGFAIKEDGTLWSWGTSLNGQLGLNFISEAIEPQLVYSEKKWLKVAAYQEHAIGLKEDGTIWGWGQNIYGEQGDGPGNIKWQPENVSSDSTWADIEVGFAFSLAMSDSGKVFGAGLNQIGQLGLGDVYSVGSWTLIDSNSYVQMAAGVEHILLLREDGTLWASGRNDMGQLGIGNIVHSKTLVQVGSHNDWVEIAAFDYHSIGKTKDGSLYIWGKNSDWQMPGCDTHGAGICVTPTPTASPCSLLSNIDEKDLSNEIAFYPIPVQNVLRFKGIDLLDRLRFYDISGRKLLDLVNVGNKIDLSTMKSGIYILEAQTKNRSSRQSVIKL